MNILIWAGSTRQGSLNFQVGQKIQKILNRPDVTLREFAQDAIPLYSGDVEEVSGVPTLVEDVAKAIRAADAVVLVMPEYNGGMPGTWKNAIDWLSRTQEPVFSGKPVLLISSSPGALGGVRGLWHSRVPLTALFANVAPEMMAIPKVHEELQNESSKTWEKLGQTVRKFLESIPSQR